MNALKLGRSTKLFLTKTWGFDPEHYPTLGFSHEGARENFLRQASHGDWITIAGTKGEPTVPQEQGRLLGMCQVGHEKVDADAILRAIGTPLSPHMLDNQGYFIWRWAMPITQAVFFDPQPDLKDVLGSYLPGQVWAAYARDVGSELGIEAVEAILSLATKPCAIAKVPQLEKEAAFSQAMTLHRRYGSSGPPPTEKRAASERELGVGYAYAFVLLESKVPGAVKIGSTKDPQERLVTLNKELRPHLTGCRWEPRLGQIFPSETLAYRFEQLLLRHFRDRLVPGDREVVTVPVAELERAWTDLLFSKAWAAELDRQ